MTMQTIVDPTERVYRTTNPTTGEILREWPRLSEEEAEELVARAHVAFASWRTTSIDERIALFRTMADLIDARADDLGRQVSLEMGKILSWAVSEANLAASIFRYYADNAKALLADVPVSVPEWTRGVIRKEPMGVVLGIEPWNSPLYQSLRAVIPNLMLGNTVIIKPAEIVAASTLMLDVLFREAGFPADVYQTALLRTDQIAVLIADRRVRAVTLTGSDRAGAAVAELAGKNIKPVVLELGGSDPFIVLDSADPSSAAGLAAATRLVYSGQICVSPKRVIVTERSADVFIEAYSGIFASQKVGDPFDPDTTVGPLSSQTAVDNLEEQVQDAIAKGATVLVAGGRMEGPGAFFAPVVLTDLTPDMRLFEEEAFGPVGLIFRVADADAAIELANSSKYGLGGTVMGDETEATKVAERLDVGMVGVNTFFGAPIEVPFGGTKSSGLGRELGASGMDPFANIKTYGIV